MNGIGFKGEEAFSSGQIITLIMFIVLVFVVALFLRRNKALLERYIRPPKQASRFETEVQKIDNKASLYRLEGEGYKYLIFRAPEGVVLLDKEPKEKGNDNG